jgi:hypothetical protein
MQCFLCNYGFHYRGVRINEGHFPHSSIQMSLHHMHEKADFQINRALTANAHCASSRSFLPLPVGVSVPPPPLVYRLQYRANAVSLLIVHC